MWVKSPKVFETLYPSATWKFPSKEKELYLTFDDGPHPVITPWVLNKLKEYKAKATFFCIGRNVERYPEIFMEIKRQGHSVGNHTYSHLNGWKTSNKHYYEDVDLASQFIDSKLFRPPYGKIRPLQLQHLKKEYLIIMWDILSKDYSMSTSPEDCYKNVSDYAQRGSVIVFHDSKKAEKNMKYSLSMLLDEMEKKNYRGKNILKKKP